MSRFTVVVVVAALSAIVLTGCLSQQKIENREASDLDKKLSTFAWIESGDLVTFIVDARATRYREQAPYIPFEIAVHNRGLRGMTLTRESFTLVDADGNRYPCAGPRELLEGYEYLDLDRSPALAELEGLVFDRFAANTRYPSNFSPTRTAVLGVVQDRVSLPRHGYIVDFIYFPTPPGGVKGQRFELFLEAPELPDPVFVKFEVR